MFEAAAVQPGEALACPHCQPRSALDLGLADLPAEQENPGASIGGKPVYTLDEIYANFFRDEWRWDADDIPNSYSIPTTLPEQYYSWQGDPQFEGVYFETLSAMRAAAVHFAMDRLDEIVAIDFAFEGTNWNSDLRFMSTDWDSGGSAHAIPPQLAGYEEGKWGDVWLHYNASSMTLADGTPLIGTQMISTLMHEIGHAMGLGHPGDYNASDADAPTYENSAHYFQDSNQYTLMSYFGARATEPGAGRAAPEDTYMLHDIYVLQRAYGAEMSTRTGNTVYGHFSNAGDIYDLSVNTTPLYAIWDAGGFDTINLELATDAVAIDLRPGAFSSYGGGLNNIAIAYDHFATNASDAWIEAARGGSANDTLRGNDADNFLYGGDGNDRAHGGEGSDALYGEDGNDRLEGGDDDDLLYGNDGSDTLLGQGHDDTLNGAAGNDRLLGGDGNDSLNGGEGDDTLDGGVGLDTLNGGAGFDRVSYLYSDQDWTIDLAAGTASFGAGTESLTSIEGVWMGAGNDTVTLTDGGGYAATGGGDDLIVHADGNNTVDGGLGFDRYDYGAADHAVRVDLRATGNQKVIDRAGDADDRIDRISGIEWLEGTAFGDTLIAAHAANRLEGNGGNDNLRAIGTGDTLLGGAGNDTLIAGTGDDHLAGGDGFDMLSLEYAAAGVAVAIGGSPLAMPGLGTDSWSSIEALRGSAHADTLTGSDGANRIEGGSGHDRLLARGGADTLHGHNGNDWMNADNDNALAAGDDLAFGGIGADTIIGGFGDDTLQGEEHNDNLAGGAGNNDLYGGDGADTLSASTGNDLLDGGAGFDMVDYRAIGSGVVINLGQALQNPAGAGTDELIGIEGLFGTAHADILWGQAAQSSSLYGMDGADELRGGTAADLLSGGNGNDTLVGWGGGDTLTGGAGRDLARFDFASAALIINLEVAGDQQTGGAGLLRINTVDDLIGGAFNDTLAGNSGANELRGGLGADRLFGRDGHDGLYGGDGADTLDGGAGNDSLYGEGDADTASYETATSGVLVDLGAFGVQFTWGSGWDLLSSIANLTGSTHDDILRGSVWANVIRDLEGADLVEAGADNDTIFAGTGGADTYDGESGSDLISYAETWGAVNVDLLAGTALGLGIFSDTLIDIEHVTGGTGNDTIAGHNGANRLEGGAGNDSLLGGAGNDTILGGNGGDRLNGGAGADEFVFGVLQGTDRIQDFELGLDRIRFTSGPDSFDDLVFGAFGSITGPGVSVMVGGVDTALLTAADFVFG